MPKTAWPVEADVRALASGQALPDAFDFATAVNAIVAKAEAITGRSPLLADAEDSDELYDPTPGLSGRRVQSIDDFASLTSVTIHWDGSAGHVLSEPHDYLSQPRRRERGWPIEGLEFRHGAGCAPASVRVVGRRGSFVSLPLDLWEAVAKAACAKALLAGVSAKGPVKRRKQGEREVEYAVTASAETPSALARQYQAEFEATLQRYVKVSVDG